MPLKYQKKNFEMKKKTKSKKKKKKNLPNPGKKSQILKPYFLQEKSPLGKKKNYKINPQITIFGKELLGKSFYIF